MFTVIGYYTKNTLYESHARRFMESLKQFKIPSFVMPIDSLGTWRRNTNYKPTFIKDCLKKIIGRNLVYVDCDAEFLQYPNLFDELGEDIDCDIAVHLFDKSQHGSQCKGFEILSGTIFLKNNKTVYDLIERWELECKRRPTVWDQKSLQEVLGENYTYLPACYCTIFDVMKHVKNPVIIHHQASREVRKRNGKLD